MLTDAQYDELAEILENAAARIRAIAPSRRREKPKPRQRPKAGDDIEAASR